jgi:hydroxymethylpyrimidine/phosphomethylpyrimidine kinase
VYGTSAITAVTAQNTMQVVAVRPLDPELVTAQIDAVARDITLHATKTGMLATAAIVEAVACAAARLRLPALVVDPVMVAKSGDRLLDPAAVRAVQAALLPLAAVVTPNIPEAEVLSGVPIRGAGDRREAARAIHALGVGAVVVKGGHAEGGEVVDLLYDGERFTEFRTPRVDTSSTHGTGCTFAAALAARLARGTPLAEATAAAQAYVAGAIRHAVPVGHGHGPLNHFWQTGC